jgi:hypothetical protein
VDDRAFISMELREGRLFRSSSNLGTRGKIFGGAYATDRMETEFEGFKAKHWERCGLKITFVDRSPLLAKAYSKLCVLIELF